MVSQAFLLLAAAASAATAADDDIDALCREWLKRPVLEESVRKEMLPRFVRSQLGPLPLPDSREEWDKRRESLQRRVLATLGIADLMPPTWDLGIQHQGALKRDGYTIEKIVFESYPGVHVPALVYVPDDLPGKAPGIVSIAGHVYGLGKAAEFLQQRNVNLARRGCVVLSYDYIDTGERNTGPDPRGGKPYGGGNDHSIRSFSFSKRNPTGLEVLDAIRAVDLLVARPEVDPDRVGFTGESGGGNSTYWVAAVDPRVKLAVPVSSVTTFDYWIRTNRNWDWHQRPHGIRRFADIGVLLALHAPRPLLVISSKRGTDDHEFPLEEAQKSVDWAAHVYRLLDAGDAIQHVESSTAHGYQVDKRQHLYRAVERWLEPPFPQGDAELPAKLESFDDLCCGLHKNAPTFHDVYGQWLESLPRTPADPTQREIDLLRSFLRKRLAFPEENEAGTEGRALTESERDANLSRQTGPASAVVPATRVGREDHGGSFAEFWSFEPEPGIRLPGVLIGKSASPAAEPPSEATIVLIPGRDAEAAQRALSAGYRVFGFDPRGTGEAAEDLGVVRNWAWFVGRPLAGQWAWDVTQAARLCRQQFQAKSVHVEAQNAFGFATLLAGAAEPQLFQSGRVSLPYASMKDVIRDQGDAAIAEVPGLLERIDVPHLRTMCPELSVSVP